MVISLTVNAFHPAWEGQAQSFKCAYLPVAEITLTGQWLQLQATAIVE